MEDYEIICLFWERDETAIKHTEAKYGGKLRHLAMKILNSREDTAECVNDTLLKTWNTIPPQKPTYFFAYIAKICRNISFGMLDWKNAQKRNAEIIELTDEMQSCIPDPLSNVDRMIQSEEIGRLLNIFVDDKFVEEAESVTRIKRISSSWRYYFATAACFIFAISMAMLIPNAFDTPDTPPAHVTALPHQTAPVPNYPEIHQVDMSRVLVNDIRGVSAGGSLYDPELHEIVTWTMDEIVAYYGKNPAPAYIPDILTASPYNESGAVLVEKSGAAVNDLVYFDFNHAYDNNGNPLLDETSGAKTGFSVAVSKIGTTSKCFYTDADHLETTCIGDTPVILGGMGDPYKLYTASFQHDDIHYLIIAEQMQLEEVVKVTASIIFESENISINN